MVALGRFGPPHDPGPTPQEIRSRQLEQARRAGWPELDHDDLVYHRFGIVEHAPSGGLYAIHRGELCDVVYASASAYFVNDRNEVVFLEAAPPGSPQTRAELEQQQAEHRQRREAPKPKPAWMTRRT